MAVVILDRASFDLGYYNGIALANNEANVGRVFREVWQLLFTPSAAVATRIDQQLAELQLVPGQYTAVHVRSRYKNDFSDDRAMIENSIHCAARLQPGAPIFFASDSSKAAAYALEFGYTTKQHNITRIVARSTNSEPLHLDKGAEFYGMPADTTKNYTAADFYDTFVDLYLLAHSRCTAYGFGNYGSWSNLMSHDRKCSVRHSEVHCH